MGDFKMRNVEFEDFAIPKWKIAMKNAAGKAYRVFKNEKEFETIEAESVNEAITKSGFKKVFKVIPAFMGDQYLFQQSMLVNDEGQPA